MSRLFYIGCAALLGLAVSSIAPAAEIYKERVNPHWFTGPGGAEMCWYRLDLKDGRKQFVFVDPEHGQRVPAFDHARVAAGLSRILNKTVQPDALPFDSLTYSPDGNSLTLHGEDADYQLDAKTYEIKQEPATPGEDDYLQGERRPHPSRFTGPATTVKFYNKLARAVDLYWISPTGDRQLYAHLTPGQEYLQNTYAGHAWMAAEANGDPIAVYQAEEEPAVAVIGGPRRERPRAQPEGEEGPNVPGANSVSPDGRWDVVVRQDNLYLRNAANGAEEQLTRDAAPAHSYARNAEAERGMDMNYNAANPGAQDAEVYWSPDSRHFVAMQHTLGSRRRVTEVRSSPKDQVQPEVVTFPYLKPGDDVPYGKPHLFDAQAGREIPVSDALFATPWSIDNVRWEPDSREFTFEFNQRGHQVFRILGVNAESGAARAIVDERSRTFICYSSKYFVRYLDGTGEIIWMSERDGWNHLYLYDARTGAVKNQITRGPWVVRGVDHVDAKNRQIWFHAGGMNAGEDPYFENYYRVNFDGTGLTALSGGNGNHIIKYSPDRRYLIDTWSRVDQAPVNELRRTADGKLLCRLEEADASDLYSSGAVPPIPFSAKGRDGQTDIYGVIFRPRPFDPAKKYPVLEDIYAGPQDSYVPKNFQSETGMQWLANDGFVIVQIDGMGTSNRSKAFHDVCWKNLGDAGFPDRILWIKAAAARYPWMDLSRVGIYGTSAGGQNAMRALLDHGDFYKAAVADSGCHDNRIDKIWWNEQWMGWPVDDSYVRSSNVVDAHKLQGKLLLMVGEMDDNVDPSSTMQVVNALIKANKDFDLLDMPNMGHGVASTPYGKKRLEEFFVRAFLDGGKS